MMLLETCFSVSPLPHDTGKEELVSFVHMKGAWISRRASAPEREGPVGVSLIIHKFRSSAGLGKVINLCET